MLSYEQHVQDYNARFEKLIDYMQKEFQGQRSTIPTLKKFKGKLRFEELISSLQNRQDNRTKAWPIIGTLF